MLSHLHATLTEMFRHRPELAADVLTDLLHVALPEHQRARVSPTEVPAPRPTELHADAVVHLEDQGRTVAAVIVEIQLRPDDEKRWTWPVYVTAVRRRSRAPAVLLVVCPDPTTARWAATPIELGPASLVQPAVLGPGLVPVVTDVPSGADAPELAVLSALAHAQDPTLTPRSRAVLDALVAALASVPDDRAIDYASLVLDALPESARTHLEDLLTTQPHIHDSYLARRYRAEGEARGEAHGRAAILLRILDRRGVQVPEQARARITSCSDLDQLETWSDRALTASTVDEVLDRA